MVRNVIYLKELKKNIFSLRVKRLALRKDDLHDPNVPQYVSGLYNFKSKEFFSFKSYIENLWAIDESFNVLGLKARHNPEILNLNVYKPKFESLTMAELYC